jgi:hypothetical protein
VEDGNKQGLDMAYIWPTCTYLYAVQLGCSQLIYDSLRTPGACAPAAAPICNARTKSVLLTASISVNFITYRRRSSQLYFIPLSASP